MRRMKGEVEIEFTKQPYIEDNEPRKIKSIQFSMFSEAEICKIGEVQVNATGYYDNQRKPVANGLLDRRMGPPNKHSDACATCHGRYEDCPGHYGYLKLALPCFNIGYIGAALEVLKCICKSCSRIMLPEKECQKLLMKMRKSKTALQKTEVKKMIVKKFASKPEVRCLRCGYMNGKVKKGNTVLAIVHNRPKQEKNTEETRAGFSTLINPHEALGLFKQMQDQDCELLYLNERPEKLMISSVPVPPMSIRPSVSVGGGMQSNESDITERLKRIIQANACLRQGMQEPSNTLKFLDDWEYLQVEAAQYINSDVRVASQNQPTKPLSGLVQRLKGKQGRFRGNLSGKRVEFTGRTVISPDPNLKITEVAIPQLMAMILTYPERVNNQNIEKLRQCVRNGPKKYPGAKLVVEPNGDKKDLSFSSRKRIADELKIGYIVTRHLEDGDVVLFNRQPSLHRMSIMCHRARIMPWRTLRFNESVCNPYNADFDGDEMNMHVPQTEEARAEAFLLMGVQNNLCTPKNGTILVASTQDFLTSSFLITRKDTFYDRAAFSALCSYMGDGMDIIDLPTPALVKPIELWTGKQLFSILIRPHSKMKVFVNLMVKEKNFTKKKAEEKSDEADVVKKEETMCPADGFVYFRNSELISGQVGKATLGNGNKVGLFSVLVRDYGAHAAAACMNRMAKLSARWIGNHGFSIGIDDVQAGKFLNKLDEEKEKGYKACQSLIEEHDSGKLKPLSGCDLAQTLETGITKSLNEIRDETGKVCMKELPWRNSPKIMSQCGSKGSPINISQMVACVGQQAVGGLRAPDGFIDRSLPHFRRKQNTPAAKGFVANSFYSGLTATEFFFHTMGGREGLVDTAVCLLSLYNDYERGGSSSFTCLGHGACMRVKTADTGYMSRRLMKCLEDLAVNYDMTVRDSSGTIVQFIYGDDGMDPGQMEGAAGFPLDLERLRFKVEATCPARGAAYLSDSEISETVNKRLSVNNIRYCSDAFKKKLLQFFDDLSKRNCYVSQQQLQVFLDACISRLRSKGIEPGTGIGAIGAQSIGEPGTQMTLKTFHFAGVASMNVTLGVPRIKEIIAASKKISTPVITAKLDDDSEKAACTMKGQLEKTLLEHVSKSITLVKTSTSASVVVKLDMGIINSLGLEINAYIIKEKIEISLAKRKADKPNVRVLNDAKLVVTLDANKNDFHFAIERLANKLPSVIVKGIDTVERVIVADEKKQKDKVSKEEKQEREHYLIVEGTGLREVMGFHGVNGCKTVSNHIIEVHQTLGIEAARSLIITEINTVMKGHGMDIDIRHMMLLADMMTSKGEVLAVNRVGMSKMKESVMMLASFEKTADHLMNAAVSGKEDMIEGVSESIIMGIPVQVGTGMMKIQQRVDSLPAFKYELDPIV